MRDMETSSKPKALITGASAGIGAEFARQLAARGYDLVLVARRKDRLEQLAETIMLNADIRVEILPADLAVEEGISSIEDHIRTCENLEILVNNAGFGITGGFLGTDISLTLSMIRVHVMAPVRLISAVLPGMKENMRGSIINVSSISAFTASTGSSTYSATKSYLNNFSEGLAVECVNTGVKVQALCPGFTHTEFHDTPEFRSSRIKEQVPGFLWMTSEAVVRYSLNAMNGQKVIVIPGLGNQLIAFAGRLGLISILLGLITKISGKCLVDMD